MATFASCLHSAVKHFVSLMLVCQKVKKKCMTRDKTENRARELTAIWVGGKQHRKKTTNSEYIIKQ